jgi:methyl-accepting chemotaxis protein
MALPCGRNGPGFGGRCADSPGVTQSHRLWSVAFKNRLVLVFSLLVFVVIAVNAKFIWDITDEMALQRNVLVSQSAERAASSTATVDLLRNFRYQLLILAAVTIACFLAIVYLFVKSVVVPLSDLVQAVGKISRGDLSITLLNHDSSELGELGSVVTGVAADFQEVVLMTGATVGNSVSSVERIEEMLQQSPPPSQDDLKTHVGSIRKDLETLSAIVKRFQFYHAHFDGRKVVSHGPGTEN